RRDRPRRADRLEPRDLADHASQLRGADRARGRLHDRPALLGPGLRDRGGRGRARLRARAPRRPAADRPDHPRERGLPERGAEARLRIRARRPLRPPRREALRPRGLMLETERLLLRLPEVEDVEGYSAVFGDPEVVAFLGMAPQTRTENLAGIRTMRPHWNRHGIGLFSVVRRAVERLLGRTGLLLWDPERWVSPRREALGGELGTEIGWTRGSGCGAPGDATRGQRA